MNCRGAATGHSWHVPELSVCCGQQGGTGREGAGAGISWQQPPAASQGLISSSPPKCLTATWLCSPPSVPSICAQPPFSQPPHGFSDTLPAGLSPSNPPQQQRLCWWGTGIQNELPAPEHQSKYPSSVKGQVTEQRLHGKHPCHWDRCICCSEADSRLKTPSHPPGRGGNPRHSHAEVN